MKPRLRWWQRVFKKKPQDDTIAGIYQKLAFETSVLFASFTTVGGALWYLYGTNLESTYDGMARNALHRRWGEQLFLSDKILFKSQSHRVYSALNIATGDCFVYALHFPSGGVWSTRLEADDDHVRQTIWAPNGYINTSEYVETDRPFYTKEVGIFGALQRWGSVTHSRHRLALEEMSPTWNSNVDFSLKMEVVTVYFGHMFPWMVYSGWWAAKFPVSYTLGTHKDPSLTPPVDPTNPTIKQWRTALKTATNGIPLTSAGGDIDISEEGFMVHLGGVVMRLKPDEAAAVHMMNCRSVFVNFFLFGSFAASFMTFKKYWKTLASLPHDHLYNCIATKPRDTSMRFARDLGARLGFLRFAVGFVLLGQIFYENSKSFSIYFGSYLGTMFLWDSAVCYMLLKYVHAKSIPTALVVRGTVKDGQAIMKSRSFFKHTRPAGNVAPGELLDSDLILKPSDMKAMQEDIKAANRQLKWSKSLHSYDLEAIKREDEEKKALAEKQRIELLAARKEDQKKLGDVKANSA